MFHRGEVGLCGCIAGECPGQPSTNLSLPSLGGPYTRGQGSGSLRRWTLRDGGYVRPSSTGARVVNRALMLLTRLRSRYLSMMVPVPSPRCSPEWRKKVPSCGSPIHPHRSRSVKAPCKVMAKCAPPRLSRWRPSARRCARRRGIQWADCSPRYSMGCSSLSFRSVKDCQCSAGGAGSPQMSR